MKRLRALTALALCIAIGAQAQQIHVPADHSSIQAAIDAARDDDTIIVSEGTYYENINFKGKAITVASKYILNDTCETCVSKTIIDGSQGTGPVVHFNSGEDTTSVLLGFTIQGGKGLEVSPGGWTPFAGGGILLFQCGGKIIYNTIRQNVLEIEESHIIGGGICAFVSNDHSAIIANNQIIENSIITTNYYGYGAGVFLDGGKIYFDNNLVADNSINSAEGASGGGIYWGNLYVTGDEEVCEIGNNRILRNIIQGEDFNLTLGGGIATGYEFKDHKAEIFNNLICNNVSSGKGGGIFCENNNVLIMNNTVVGNKADSVGHSFGCSASPGNVIFNNIFWSGESNETEEVFIALKIKSLVFKNNILPSPFSYTSVNVVCENNTYMEPLFIEDGYMPAPNSPARNRGAMEIVQDALIYQAPLMDYGKHLRPISDEFPTIGAIESQHIDEEPEFNNAALARLQFLGVALVPEFHPDTLHYSIEIHDTITNTDFIALEAVDRLSAIDIDYPSNFPEGTPEECTMGITVTSSDSSATEEYEVLWIPQSTDARICSMSTSVGEWNLPFDPDTYYYIIDLPSGTTEVPEISITSCHDSVEIDTDWVGLPLSVDSDASCKIKVTCESGSYKRYILTFHVQSDDATLRYILLDAELVEGFQPDILEYWIPLPEGTTEISKVTFMRNHDLAHFELDTIAELPDTVDYIIKVTAEGGNVFTYVLHFFIGSSDATLSSLEPNPGKLYPDFDPTILEYTLRLVEGTDELPGFSCETSHDQASFEIKEYGMDSIYIEVTAEDRIHQLTYSISEVIVGMKAPGNDLLKLYPNPVNDILRIEIPDGMETESVCLYDIAGRKVAETRHTTENHFELDCSGFQPGVYILKVTADRAFVRKIIVE